MAPQQDRGHPSLLKGWQYIYENHWLVVLQVVHYVLIYKTHIGDANLILNTVIYYITRYLYDKLFANLHNMFADTSVSFGSLLLLIRKSQCDYSL